MDTFPTGSRSILARVVSAEVRARMGAQRLTLRTLTKRANFLSHNYVAIRNRDEKPYDLDDLARLCAFFEVDAETFVREAMDRHADDVLASLLDARAAALLDMMSPEDRAAALEFDARAETMPGRAPRRPSPSAERTKEA